MLKQMCDNCKEYTTVVHDHAAGDFICEGCGVILEQRSIDETSEWRTFSNESANNDPVRVGGPSNHLLTNGGLTTIISTSGAKGDSDAFGGGRRGWGGGGGSNPDRDLIAAFQAIGDIGDRLSLIQPIKDRANEIFKKVYDLKIMRGRSNDATYAACLYIACRQEEKPRTFKEIGSAGNNISKKEIGRATKLILRQLEEDLVDMGTVNAEVFMVRFCSRLNMEAQARNAAIEIVKNTELIDLRTSRAPISKAAAAIYMVTQLSPKPLPTKDISLATGVAEGTIRNTYKDLVPFAKRLVPDWFAKPAELEKLPAS